jgi:hypothetical protein
MFRSEFLAGLGRTRTGGDTSLGRRYFRNNAKGFNLNRLDESHSVPLNITVSAQSLGRNRGATLASDCNGSEAIGSRREDRFSGG